MWEKLYVFLGILVHLVLVVYGILLVTLMSFKMNRVKNVKVLQNMTFLAMLTTMAIIIVNFILELMLEKSKAYDIFFYIPLCIGAITLYFIVKNTEKIVNKLF